MPTLRWPRPNSLPPSGSDAPASACHAQGPPRCDGPTGGEEERREAGACPAPLPPRYDVTPADDGGGGSTSRGMLSGHHEGLTPTRQASSTCRVLYMSHSTHQGVVRRAGGVSPTVNSVRFHLLAVTLLAASCAFDAAPEQEAVGASTEAILSGTPITAAQTPYVQVNPGCSGTLIRNDWVLTAGHCVPNSAESDPQTLSVVDLNQPSNTARAPNR